MELIMDKIAVIPVRAGSKRLPKKNYKAFNSRNLAEIARDKCLASGIFDKIIITSDDPFFKEIANCHEVEFLQRSKDLAGDEATTDMVIDFLFEELPLCETVLWVNSVSPLQSIEDIRNCGTRLHYPNVDCVMAINTLYQHCSISNKPINFNPNSSNEFYERARLKLKYKINKKIAFYAYQELYFLLSPSQRYFYDKTRFGTGIQYELNKKTELEIKYLKINDINVENPSSLNVLGLKISHQF